MSKHYSRNAIAVIKKRETENWIYSYADLITNLLALFVMLLIFAQTPKAKDDFRKGIEAYTQDTHNYKGYQGTGAAKIDDLRQIIADYVNKHGLASQVSLERTKTGVELTFESALMFESATAVLSDEAEDVLEVVAELLKGLPKGFLIDVEGHADSRPTKGGLYPSNWELSSARAGSVVRFLEEHAIGSQHLRAIGFGSTRPLDADGKADINRRVVIKINAEGEGG